METGVAMNAAQVFVSLAFGFAVVIIVAAVPFAVASLVKMLLRIFR